MVLTKAVVSTSRGGNKFDNQILTEIEKIGTKIIPWYECSTSEYHKRVTSTKVLNPILLLKGFS